MTAVEFVDPGVRLYCTSGACEALAARNAARVVVIDGMWDGNAVCDSEECAAQVIAMFRMDEAAPWGATDG